MIFFFFKRHQVELIFELKSLYRVNFWKRPQMNLNWPSTNKSFEKGPQTELNCELKGLYRIKPFKKTSIKFWKRAQKIWIFNQKALKGKEFWKMLQIGLNSELKGFDRLNVLEKGSSRTELWPKKSQTGKNFETRPQIELNWNRKCFYWKIWLWTERIR